MFSFQGKTQPSGGNTSTSTVMKTGRDPGLLRCFMLEYISTLFHCSLQHYWIRGTYSFFSLILLFEQEVPFTSKKKWLICSQMFFRQSECHLPKKKLWIVPIWCWTWVWMVFSRVLGLQFCVSSFGSKMYVNLQSDAFACTVWTLYMVCWCLQHCAFNILSGVILSGSCSTMTSVVKVFYLVFYHRLSVELIYIQLHLARK